MIEPTANRVTIETRLHRWANARWWWFAVAVGLAGFAYGPAMSLNYDRSITTLIDPADPSLLAYQRLQRDFGGNAAILLVYRDKELWTDPGIKRAAELSQRIESLDGVSSVLSPSVLSRAVRKIRPLQLFARGSPLLNEKDAVARGFDRMFVGYTHSLDHDRAAIVAILQPAKVDLAIEAITAAAKSIEADFDEVDQITLIGEPVLIHQAFEMIIADGRRLAVLTIGLLSLVLVLTLRSLSALLLAVSVIAWSWLITSSLMSLAGMKLSLVSTILVAIITVVVVTSAMHVCVAYLRRVRRGILPSIALPAAAVTVGVAVAVTCLTDAAGFAALLVSQIAPVRSFGTMVAIASVVILLGLFLWTPVWLGHGRLSNSGSANLLKPTPSEAASSERRRSDWPERSVSRSARRLAAFSIVHSNIVLPLALLTFFGSAWLAAKANTETSFLRNFEDDSDLVVGYDRIEKHFGGAGVWDVTMAVSDPVTDETLRAVRALEHQLRKLKVGEVGLSKVLSIADADRVVQSQPFARLLPASRRLEMMRTALPDFHDALLTPASQGKRRLRIMLRSAEELDSASKRRLIDEVSSLVNTFPGEGKKPAFEEVEVTGYYVLMTQLIQKIVQDGWRSFAVAVAVVGLILWLYTRSFRLAVVAVIANTLPSLIVLAVASLAGGKLNMGSAMIAAVSIGLSIDGSVHFFASYLRQRRRGHGARWSAVNAAGRIGLPMVVATVALVVGFGAMFTSEFVPTSTFGLLVAATLVMGTTINFTLLPAVVVLIDRRKSATLID